MPNWKKVITSGSNAVLNHITASGNISASGHLYGQNFRADSSLQVAGKRITYVSPNLRIPDTGLEIHGGGHITASGNISSSGTITANSFVGDGSSLTGVNNYVLPTNLAGDDIDIDTGALTGATVISDLDINITTNTSGLVTDANASVATRTLTAANLSLGNVTNESKATMFTSPTFTGTLTTPLSKIGLRDLDWAGNIEGNSAAYAQGDVIYNAASITTVAGSIYHMQTNGNLSLADANAVSTSSTLLVVALSTNATDGLLLRGTVVLRTNPAGNPGALLYVSTTAGEATRVAPTGTGDVVRVLGYQLTNGLGTANVCYFNPDNTWVELT